MTIKKLALASLVEDFEVYPRTHVDDAHVSRLVEALKAGETLPPPTADAKSKVISDGFHTSRALKKIHGPEAKVDVDLISYKSRDELVQDAIARNSRHGRKLDAQDMTRAALMLKTTGMDQDAIAQVLCVTPGKVEKLLVHFVVVPKGTPRSIVESGRTLMPSKRSISRLNGAQFTKKQATAVRTAPGTNYRLLVRQLTEGIENGFVDIAEPTMAASLTALADAIDKAIR